MRLTSLIGRTAPRFDTIGVLQLNPQRLVEPGDDSLRRTLGKDCILLLWFHKGVDTVVGNEQQKNGETLPSHTVLYPLCSECLLSTWVESFRETTKGTMTLGS